MTEPLHTKYRPRDLNEVYEQNGAMHQLERCITKGTSRAFLLVGPSGVGKTTLARIGATMAGCDNGSITEIDAATNSGVDAMRAVAEAITYHPFGKSSKRATIVDEAHGLSRQAWDTLLKVVEEPPKHALWFFCTTNPAKIPNTIKTRCTTLTLKLVSEKGLRALVHEVANLEKMKMDAGVVDLVVREARGSPRQALVNLAACDGITSKREAAEVLHTVLETDATLELCRFLMKPGSWMKCQALVAKLDGESPEGVRILVVNYMASVLKGARSDREATHVLSILEAFAQPYAQYENLAPLWLSIGRVMYP